MIVDMSSGRQAEEAVQKSGQPKILVVYEAVVKNGPITLDEIYPLVNYSRSATFRVLKYLEHSGWIRKLINGHQFVATSRIDELISCGAVSLPEVDLVCNALIKNILGSGFHADIGIYVTNRKFFLLESTAKTQTSNSLEFPYSCAAALVAYCHMESEWDEGMLFPCHLNVTHHDHNKMTVKLNECRKQLSQNNYYFCDEEYSAAIGLIFENSSIGALKITKKRISRNDAEIIRQKIEQIIKALQEENILVGRGL